MTVGKSGSGSGTVTSTDGDIDCGSVCSHTYGSGTQVTLNAQPASSSTFSGWSGGGCSGTGSCVVTLSSAQTVTAAFTAQSAGKKATLVGQPKSTGSGVSDQLGSTAPAGESCEIAQTLTSTEKNHKTVVVGTKTVTVAAGHKSAVTIELNATGLQLLKRSGKLLVTLTVQLVLGSKKTTAATRTLTIKPPPKRASTRECVSGPVGSDGRLGRQARVPFPCSPPRPRQDSNLRPSD